MSGPYPPLRVYRIPFSTNVERVALALAHKNIEVDWVSVDPADRSAVVGVSGQELVPVLVDGHRVVADSTAILEYLEERFPERPLFPVDRARRAEVRVFVDWFNQVWKLPPNLIVAEEGKPEPDRVRIAELEGLIAALPLFEDMLAGRDFLFGEELSVADIATFPFLTRMRCSGKRATRTAFTRYSGRRRSSPVASPCSRRGSSGSTRYRAPRIDRIEGRNAAATRSLRLRRRKGCSTCIPLSCRTSLDLATPICSARLSGRGWRSSSALTPTPTSSLVSGSTRAGAAAWPPRLAGRPLATSPARSPRRHALQRLSRRPPGAPLAQLARPQEPTPGSRRRGSRRRVRPTRPASPPPPRPPHRPVPRS